ILGFPHHALAVAAQRRRGRLRKRHLHLERVVPAGDIRHGLQVWVGVRGGGGIAAGQGQHGHRRERAAPAAGGAGRGALWHLDPPCADGYQRGLAGMGNGVTTFSPVPASRIADCPFFSTSSMRSTLCIGRCRTFVLPNSSRRRSSVGSTTTPSCTSNTSSPTSVKPQRLPLDTLRA